MLRTFTLNSGGMDNAIKKYIYIYISVVRLVLVCFSRDAKRDIQSLKNRKILSLRKREKRPTSQL